jgi:hypothetical protein
VAGTLKVRSRSPLMDVRLSALVAHSPETIPVAG